MTISKRTRVSAPGRTATGVAARGSASHASGAPTRPAPGSAAALAEAVLDLPTAPPEALPVREDEDPWTADELAGVRTDLEDDIRRLQREISVAETDLAGLMRDAGDGAGDDQADAGAKTFEREQEISLAHNQREMLEQSEHAVQRIADGSYGRCESCGNGIGKLRLQAFPRATLCLPCKQKQERR